MQGLTLVGETAIPWMALSVVDQDDHLEVFCLQRLRAGDVDCGIPDTRTIAQTLGQSLKLLNKENHMTAFRAADLRSSSGGCWGRCWSRCRDRGGDLRGLKRLVAVSQVI
jgi:hypothetical protein